MSFEQKTGQKKQNSLAQNSLAPEGPGAAQREQRRQNSLGDNDLYWKMLEQQKKEQEKQRQTETKKKPWALIICLCILCMALICGGAFFLGRTMGQGETDGGQADNHQGESLLQTQPAALEPEYVTLKVWAPLADQLDGNAWLPQVQAQFQAAHPEYIITWENGVCYEGDAATMVTADPAAAADVYLYANDQLGTLVQAGALAKLGGSYLEQIRSDVSATYVNTVTATDGNVYGFPVAPNTWFMYYNKDLLTEEDVKSMEACLKKGIVAFEVRNSWYLPAFFFAAGGTLFGKTGADAAAGVNFGGQIGINATNAVLNLLDNPNFKVDGDYYGVNGLRNGTVAAYFSGSWDYAVLYEALGDKLGAVPAPTVMVAGAPAQLKAYAGSKAIGINPNAKNIKAAMQFAAFLASSDSQLLRFRLRNITPAVTALVNSPEVSASIVAVAESKTMAYASVAQPTIPEMNPVWGPVGYYGGYLTDGTIDRNNVAEWVNWLENELNGG